MKVEIENLSRDDLKDTLNLCISILQSDSELDLWKRLLTLKQLAPFVCSVCPTEKQSAYQLNQDLFLGNVDSSLFFSYYFDIDLQYSQKISAIDIEMSKKDQYAHEKIPHLESLEQFLRLGLIDSWLIDESIELNSSATMLLVSFTDLVLKSRTRQILTYVLPVFRAVYQRLALNNEESSINLTKREVEILHWIREGKSSWEISTIIQCSKRTVDFHVSNFKRKLKAENRTQALVKALEKNLISF